jgi:hypothetical protein
MSTVALTIDYSNGAQKHYSNIPWTKDLTILAAIQATEQMPPRTTVKFGSDRSGHAMALVIDEMPGQKGAFTWSFWINATPFKGGDRLGTGTSFNFNPDEREANLLKPGDHVVVKLSQVADDPA